MAEVRTTSMTGAQKVTKPERFSLIPTSALNKIAAMYGEGVKKYNETPNNPNWRKGYEWSKSYDALMRHVTAFWGGEDIDPETGQPHMAAVVFHSFTLLTFMEEHPEFDDRYKGVPNEIPTDQALQELRRTLTEGPDVFGARGEVDGLSGGVL